MLKESRGNQGQRAGHVGTSTFAGEVQVLEGSKVGEAALTKGVSQRVAFPSGQSNQAVGFRVHDTTDKLGDEEGELALTRLPGRTGRGSMLG